MPETRPRIRQIGRIIIPVADQDRAIAFYTETLGFELQADQPFGDGERWVEVVPPGAATAIALTPERPGFETGLPACIALESEDVDADHAALKGRGVDVDAEVMRMGGGVPPMFFFRDVDGNNLLMVGDDG